MYGSVESTSVIKTEIASESGVFTVRNTSRYSVSSFIL